MWWMALGLSLLFGINLVIKWLQPYLGVLITLLIATQEPSSKDLEDTSQALEGEGSECQACALCDL